MGELPEINIINISTEGLSKAAEGAVKIVESYLAGNLSPERMVAMAQARADASLIETEAAIERQQRLYLASQRLLRAEAEKQESFVDLARRAIPHVKDDAKPEKVSREWIGKFYDASGASLDEEVRDLWARLFAGEVNRPGAFNKRTLTIVSELERQEALDFSTLCNFVVNIGMIDRLVWLDWHDDVYKRALPHSRVLALQAAGLVHVNSSYYEITGYSKGAQVPIAYAGKGFLHVVTAGDSVRIGHLAFTQAGEQLRALVATEEVPGFFKYLESIYARK